jgi:hypothetical protein
VFSVLLLPSEGGVELSHKYTTYDSVRSQEENGKIWEELAAKVRAWGNRPQMNTARFGAASQRGSEWETRRGGDAEGGRRGEGKKGRRGDCPFAALEPENEIFAAREDLDDQKYRQEVHGGAMALRGEPGMAGGEGGVSLPGCDRWCSIAGITTVAMRSVAVG